MKGVSKGKRIVGEGEAGVSHLTGDERLFWADVVKAIEYVSMEYVITRKEKKKAGKK